MVWWQHCYKLCFCASNYNGSSGIKLTKSQQSEQTACLGLWFRYVFAITFTEDQAIVRVQEIPNLMNLCKLCELTHRVTFPVSYSLQQFYSGFKI